MTVKKKTAVNIYKENQKLHIFNMGFSYQYFLYPNNLTLLFSESFSENCYRTFIDFICVCVCIFVGLSFSYSFLTLGFK